MCQNIQRLLFLSAGISSFLFTCEPTIPLIQSALAAPGRGTVTAQGSNSQEKYQDFSQIDRRTISRKDELAKEIAAPHRLLGRYAVPQPLAEMSNDVSLRSSSLASHVSQLRSENSQLKVMRSQLSNPNTVVPSSPLVETIKPRLGGATPIVDDTFSLVGSTSPTLKTVAAPLASAMETRPPTAPLRRLMSEMPKLKQLAAPPIPNSSPPAPKPAIGVSSSSFSFSAQQGDGRPKTQTLTVTNIGRGTLHWNAAATATWLTLGLVSGKDTGTITITATSNSLIMGTYNAAITLSAAGATAVTIPVHLTVEAAPVPPIIRTSPATLSFTAAQGDSNSSSQTLSISNAGGGLLTWTASENVSWLSISTTSGTGNGSVTVTTTPGSLAAGAYNTLVTINATNAVPVTIPISLTVTAPSTTVALSPSSLTFAGVQGGANPASQTVTVNSNGKWTANSSTSWLTLSPSSGNGNGSITVHVALSSAVVGTNNSTITVTSGGVARTMSVALTVSAASLTASPGTVTYTATQGAANPSAQTIAIGSNGTWSASDGASWLSLSPTSGSHSGVITASVNTATATQGSNSTAITVTSGGITRTVNVILTLNAQSSSSVTLTWNANTESDLAGYRVYRATSSGTYGAPIATIQGNTTSYIAAGLKFGTTYFFVVTAFDIAGNESAYSNEVSKSIF